MLSLVSGVAVEKTGRGGLGVDTHVSEARSCADGEGGVRGRPGGSGVDAGNLAEEGGGGIEVGFELSGLGGAEGLGELPVELLPDLDAGGLDGFPAPSHADALGAGVGGVGNLLEIALPFHEADQLAHGLLGDASSLGELGRPGSSLIQQPKQACGGKGKVIVAALCEAGGHGGYVRPGSDHDASGYVGGNFLHY